MAGSSKGYTHTAESIDKMREVALGRKHTEEVKQAMSASRKGEANAFFLPLPPFPPSLPGPLTPPRVGGEEQLRRGAFYNIYTSIMYIYK